MKDNQQDSHLQIESLIREIESLPDPRARSAAQALTQGLLELHRRGLVELLAAIAKSDGGGALLRGLSQIDLVSSLLLLHGLHPIPFDARVRGAVEALQAQARAQGGSIEVLEIEDGAVSLRLSSVSTGCGSPSALLHIIEQAVYDAAPDAVKVTIEHAAERLITLGRSRPNPATSTIA